MNAPLPRLTRLAAAFCAAVPLVTAACTGGDTGGWTGTREQIDGVEIVRNPAGPLHPTGALRFAPLWTAPDAAAEAALGDWEQPSAVRVAGDRVFVLDRMAHRVHVLERATGRWTHSFGRRGGGPGEFERAFGLAVGDGEVVVGNGGRATLERYDPQGTHVGSLPIVQMSFVLHELGDGFLVSGLVGEGTGYRRVRRDGTVDEVVLPVADPALPDVGRPGDCARLTTGGDRIYRLDCTRPVFQVIDERGTLLRTVLVDRPAVAVPQEEIERHLTHVRANMAQSNFPPAMVEEQIRRQREAVRLDRRMRAVRPEHGGTRLALWEQKAVDLGGGPASLHLFSGDGIYLAAAAFPDAWSDFTFADGVIYALVQDGETGLVRLVAYRAELDA